MSYEFIKESFDDIYNEGRVNESDLIDFLAFKENNFILKHNISAIVNFLKFLKSPNNIFILNGFMGSGKTHCANIFTDFISDDVLLFQNSYQEAITLDDILLSLFKDFTKYHNEKKTILPKIESNIFSEKINAYIKSCNKPMLFIFDSFEINTRSKDIQKDILDFINFLSHFEKIKIVICSRSFKENNLISDIGVTSHSLSELSKEELYDYLNDYSISGSRYEIDELYKITRGHYILTELSVLILNLTHLSLGAFCSEYTKSARNFLEFIVTKLFSLSSEKFIKLLILLSTIRHGLTEEFLISHDFTTQEDISYLLQKHIIAEKFGQYYVKDYVKSEYLKSFSAETKIQVHEYLIKLYEDELPLKPFDRELFLSRQTMRQEIAFHKDKIGRLNEELEKTGKSKLSDTKDFNYLSYSKNSGYEVEPVKEKQKTKRYIKHIKTSDSAKQRRIELSKEDSAIFSTSSNNNTIENMFKEIVTTQGREEEYTSSEQKNINDYEIDIPKSLDEYVEIAKKYEKAYNFTSAILYYEKALTYKDDSLFSEKEPVIYSKIAQCYKKIQNYEKAISIYEKAYELYIKKSTEQAHNILIEIAQIYNELYKFDKVKEVYERILYSANGVSTPMAVKCYLGMSEIADNNLEIEDALKYAQMALNTAEKVSDIRLLTECYFKNAILFDDNNNLDMAQKYYLRCIQCSKNIEENPFLSSAYSNLAGISLDNNNISAAKMYYELAIDADKKTNNYEGLYYSYTKLAAIYKNSSTEKHYEYLVKALNAAKRFEDNRYCASTYVEIGEYYSNIKDYKRALKAYMLAKNITSSYSSDNIINKINNGINKIKMILGNDEFLKLINEIKKKR